MVGSERNFKFYNYVSTFISSLIRATLYLSSSVFMYIALNRCIFNTIVFLEYSSLSAHHCSRKFKPLPTFTFPLCAAWLLVQLKRAKLPPTDLILFYNTCVRSVIVYAVQVFYNALPQYLANKLVRVEKRRS